MSETLKKLLLERKSKSIEDEIRTCVLAKYSELQGVETEKSELEATLDALQEITNLPRNEIDKIASDVQVEYDQKPVSISKSLNQPNISQSLELSLEQMDERSDYKKKEFVYHLVPYVIVNTTLVILNLITTRFPWSMFPLFFWGIGLASHYLEAIFWPKKKLIKTMSLLKGQIHQILSESSSSYRSGERSNLFQGLVRLTLTESSKEHLEEYLSNADPELSKSDVKQISTQVVSLQNRLLKQKSGP